MPRSEPQRQLPRHRSARAMLLLGAPAKPGQTAGTARPKPRLCPGCQPALPWLQPGSPGLSPGNARAAGLHCPGLAPCMPGLKTRMPGHLLDCPGYGMETGGRPIMGLGPGVLKQCTVQGQRTPSRPEPGRTRGRSPAPGGAPLDPGRPPSKAAITSLASLSRSRNRSTRR